MYGAYIFVNKIYQLCMERDIGFRIGLLLRYVKLIKVYRLKNGQNEYRGLLRDESSGQNNCY